MEATVGNLRLMRCYLPKAPQEVLDWWTDGEHVPRIDPCFYNVAYGRKEDFSTFPKLSEEEASEFALTSVEGPQAYALLLQIVSGFQSEDKGETHSRRQFYDGWSAFQANNPDRAKHYQKFIAKVKVDVNYLQNEVAAKQQKTKHEIVARDLSGQRKGEQVLIIGNVDGESIAQLTKSMIALTENKQDPSGKKRDGQSFIRITHPDEKALETIRKEVEKLSQSKQIGSNIVFQDFKDLETSFEECARVYVDLPMGMCPDADKRIIDAWNKRARKDNVLTHMGGISSKKIHSTGLWLTECAGDDYVLPEDIVHEIGRREIVNSDILNAVFMATNQLAQMNNNIAQAVSESASPDPA